MVNFDITPVTSSIIMVVGVGGGGSNAVNHMFKLGITDVSFMVCNTDKQALERSPVPTKVRLGDSLTGGLGAGNKPERGRQAALESIEEIKTSLAENNIKMVFVTAGMGGGTGTGAAPVIAKAAKEMGILTVAIVTIPFKTEGRKRIEQAISGIEEISHCVDSLLVINNENIHEIHGDLTLSEAFGKADDILATAAKSIAEIITAHYQVNVDFEDVRTVMQDSGVALMGSARGSGDNRALEVAAMAMSSPLLNHKDISGAQNVLLNITSGTKEVTLSETYQITEYIQDRAGNDNATDLIWGAGLDDTLGDDIRVTVIATGFGVDSIPALKDRYENVLPKKKKPLIVTTVQQPIQEAMPSRQEQPIQRQVLQLDDQERVVAKKKEQTEDSDDFVIVHRNNESRRTRPSDEEFNNTPSIEEVAPPQITPQPEYPAPSRTTILQETPPSNTKKSIFTLSEEEREDIPAWQRRAYILEESEKGNKDRDTVKLDSSNNPPTRNSTIDLFDE